MQFEYPLVLYWLWFVIPIVAFLLWLRKRKKQTLKRFVQESLINEIVVNVDVKKLKIKNYLLILVFVLSVVALARPQWGFEWREVRRQGIDFLIAVDTSKSMLTADVKPNRLERTKLAIKDLLKNIRGDRIGLIAFSGDAFLMCPFTTDYNGYLLSLEDIDSQTVPRGGTNLSVLIRYAIKEYRKYASDNKILVILTDGEDLEGDAIAAAQDAKSQGIRIYCVGIGTPEGELVRVPNNFGELEFLKDDQGNFVKSRLNEDLLKKISVTTGGIYVRTSGAQFGLDLIYDRELSRLSKHDIDQKMIKKYFERFQLPLALALIALIFETCISIRKKE